MPVHSRNHENENDFQKMRAFLIDARRDSRVTCGCSMCGETRRKCMWQVKR